VNFVQILCHNVTLAIHPTFVLLVIMKMHNNIIILIVSFLYAEFKTVKFVQSKKATSVKYAMMVSRCRLTNCLVINLNFNKIVKNIITALIYNSVSSVIHIALVVNIFFLVITIKKNNILF